MTARKPWTVPAAILLTALALQCNGKDGDEDADADADADITQEDVGQEDVAPEDVAVDDVVEEDAAEEDAEEEFELPECSPTTLSCGEILTDQSTVGNPSAIDTYSCSGESEPGGEMVYEISSSAMDSGLVVLHADDADLDVFVMTPRCDPTLCFASGTETGLTEGIIFPLIMGEPHYLVVDSKDEAGSTFGISLMCPESNPEVCDNGTDDNGNGLIDCSDRCWSSPNCFESDCDDGVDNDGDGYTDCENFYYCIGDEACTGGSGQIGDACDSHDDCESGMCIFERFWGWPSGACILQATDCADLECPTGTRCEDYDRVACWVDCSDGTACRSGYACVDIDADTTGDICAPGCTDSAQCTLTGYCDTDTGLCSPPPEICDNAADDDGDGLTDCDDPLCILDDACTIDVLAGGETFEEAAALTLPEGERGVVMVRGTTTGAASDPHFSCEEDGPDVFYTFTLTAAAKVHVYLYGGPDAPMLSDGVLVLYNYWYYEAIACRAFVPDYFLSVFSADLARGTYQIVVEGEGSAGGDFGLTLILEDL